MQATRAAMSVWGGAGGYALPGAGNAARTGLVGDPSGRRPWRIRRPSPRQDPIGTRAACHAHAQRTAPAIRDAADFDAAAVPTAFEGRIRFLLGACPTSAQARAIELSRLRGGQLREVLPVPPPARPNVPVAPGSIPTRDRVPLSVGRPWAGGQGRRHAPSHPGFPRQGNPARRRPHRFQIPYPSKSGSGSAGHRSTGAVLSGMRESVCPAEDNRPATGCPIKDQHNQAVVACALAAFASTPGTGSDRGPELLPP